MQAADAYNAGMQYTLRNIPKKVDQALRRKAKASGRSLNDVAVESLAIGAGVPFNGTVPKKRDLSGFVGTYVPEPEVEAALADQRRIDPEDWE